MLLYSETNTRKVHVFQNTQCTKWSVQIYILWMDEMHYYIISPISQQGIINNEWVMQFHSITTYLSVSRSFLLPTNTTGTL